MTETVEVMLCKLFIIHTTPVTVAALKELAAEMIPGHQVFNILDDSILPELIAGAPLTQVEPRVRRYVRSAAEGGADVILSACSSIGGLVVAAQGEVAVPVVRIDGAMAEQAVEMGTVIAVAATLDTTLQPTTELLKNGPSWGRNCGAAVPSPKVGRGLGIHVCREALGKVPGRTWLASRHPWPELDQPVASTEPVLTSPRLAWP